MAEAHSLHRNPGMAQSKSSTYACQHSRHLNLSAPVQVVVSGGALSLVMWFNSRTQLVHEIERRLTTVAVLRTEQLQDYLNGEMDKMQLIATRAQIVAYLSAR